jgi:hypothetical protein
MTTPVDVYESYDTVGIKEDLADIIYDISPTDTPFQSACSRQTATQVKTEWQTDVLADAALNVNLEGAEAVGAALVPTVRLHNQTQISEKTVIVSGTNEASLAAGRGGEMDYQVAKGGRELKRDMEFTLTQKQAIAAGAGGDAGTAGTNAVARALGALEVWMDAANSIRGSGGAAANKTAGQPDAAETVDDASALNLIALREADLKAILETTWQAGGDPNMIMVGGIGKQMISAFTGSNVPTGSVSILLNQIERNTNAAESTFYTAFDVYKSDFGTHSVVPNRFQRGRNCFVLDMEYWGVSYLRAFRQYPLAKTGDSVKRQLISEYTLCSKNSLASGIIADIDTTVVGA